MVNEIAPQAPPATKFVYTPEEVARAYGYHPESIRRAIRAGRIKALRFGQGWRITAAEFDRIGREGLPV
jgi:excisionase family DNA binding protein